LDKAVRPKSAETVQDICYFDNNATTRVAPEVVEAMLPFLTEHWANPSSPYQPAHAVAKAVDEARGKVAALINADPCEIIFTSCGTESNNAAIHSALAWDPARRHIVMTAVEHSANLKYGEFLARSGYTVTCLPVETDGTLDLNRLEESIRPDTAVVTVMWANNETGVLFPINAIAEICRRKGVLFHTDAVQAAGKLPIDVRKTTVDFLSLSAHKLHAPKGIGLLYVRRGVRFQPLLWGGQQEGGRRAGTENVPYIVGFGRAAELAPGSIEIGNTRVRAMRDQLERGILESIPGTRRNGAMEPRLPNTSNIAFESVESEAILIKLDQLGICASSGSACRTGALDPSHVLKAMGLSAAQARSSVRFSLGIYNREPEVAGVLTHLPGIIRQLRALFS
jgi:cysteine desulfurase